MKIFPGGTAPGPPSFFRHHTNTPTSYATDYTWNFAKFHTFLSVFLSPHSDCPLIRSDEALWRNVIFSIKIIPTLHLSVDKYRSKTCVYTWILPTYAFLRPTKTKVLSEPSISFENVYQRSWWEVCELRMTSIPTGPATRRFQSEQPGFPYSFEFFRVFLQEVCGFLPWYRRCLCIAPLFKVNERERERASEREREVTTFITELSCVLNDI